MSHIAPQGGIITLGFKNVVTGLYYVGSDTTVFRRTLGSARKTRVCLKADHFDALP